MAEDDGATPRELVIEACRRNNTDLLEEVIADVKPIKDETTEQAVAALLNGTKDALGNTALHIAAGAASYEVLDVLLDQPGLETDPVEPMQSETPLHKAIHMCNKNELVLPAGVSPNSLPAAGDLDAFLARNEGHASVDILLDAGCDPRIRNKSRMKPVDLVDAKNVALKDFLRRAEMLLMEGESVINEDAEEAVDGDGGGSGSETD